MRIFILPAAFAMTLIAVAPAGAQIAGQHDYGRVGRGDPFIGDSSLGGPGYAREVRDIRGRIREGRESGQLSRDEARRLGREARRIGAAGRRLGRDGLSPGEARELQTRALVLSQAVNNARLASSTPPRRGRR